MVRVKGNQPTVLSALVEEFAVLRNWDTLRRRP